MKLDDFTVPGKDLKVAGSLKIKSVPLDGSTSSTDTEHQGFEPKKLAVSLQISHVDENDLKSIFTAAETLGADETPKIYTIVDRTANAMGIKQCRFDGDVKIRNNGSLKAWTVSFSLIESLSNAEKTESQQKSPNGEDSSEESILQQILDYLDEIIS